MRFSHLIFVVLFTSTSTFAAEMKSLETFDFYGAPSFGLSTGSYQAGTVDEGTFGAIHYGVRLGFKLGPVMLGGDVNLMTPWIRSKKDNMSAADQVKYNMNNGKSGGSLGFNLGYYTDRVVIWGNYYPRTSIDTEGYEGMNKYKNTYRGAAYSAEINFRVWNRLYLGVFGFQQDINTYSTNHSSGTVDDQNLDPNLRVKTYGMTISYLFPISELSKVGSWFPTP